MLGRKGAEGGWLPADYFLTAFETGHKIVADDDDSSGRWPTTSLTQGHVVLW